MRLRILIGLAGLLVASLLVWKAVIEPWTGVSPADVYLNIGTEILGILITVAFVDWLLERQRRIDRARQIAWAALHEMDYAVWVWQGGARRFNIDELFGLLDLVEDSDPLPIFTQNIMQAMGATAENTLRVSPAEVGVNRDLKTGLRILGSLTSLRDCQAAPQARDIADMLKRATESLARALDLTWSKITTPDLGQHRDPAEDAQGWRRFGRSTKEVD